MGFMDKVKAQATVLAEKAQEGAKAGQGKLETLQAKRQSDALLLEIGGIVYSQRVGRADAGAEERIDSLVARLRDFEAQHGEVKVTPADGTPGATGAFVPSGAGATPEESSGSVGEGAPPAAAPPQETPSAGVPSATPGGGIPTASPSGGIPTASPSGGIPSATPGGGIPTASPGGGLPTASYSSEEETEGS